MKPKVQYIDRKCTLCNDNDIQDEHHIVLKLFPCFVFFYFPALSLLISLLCLFSYFPALSFS